MMRPALTSLALAAAVLACQKGDEKKPDRPVSAAPEQATTDRPAAIGAEDMATIDAMVQFIGGMRGAIEPNRGDCDRMAAALAPVMERGKPVLAKARALEKRLESDQSVGRWIQEYVEKKAGGFDAIAKGVEGCSDHPGVTQALAGFMQ
jgi:hypothetical protein